jgi:hypothetical protein
MASRQLVKNALAQLDTAEPRHLGAILNKVNLAKNGYYYSHYYKADYTKYYS